ncbi:hypothetical protein [Candidatus Palauibacter sp.]|uniref:hypothetical protein n=1 Tax=Candidatus Palauibacter sp. TaxID=3101350 RepID=UPI003B028B97
MRALRGAKAVVLVVLLAALADCGFTTDPEDRPLEGIWLGSVTLVDGVLSWTLWLQEDGQGNISGRVGRTVFRHVPQSSETKTPGTVSGVHEPSRVLLELDYGPASDSEIYQGRLRSEDHITGFIERGDLVRNIGTLEFRRVGTSVGGDAAGATIPRNTGITSGN